MVIYSHSHQLKVDTHLLLSDFRILNWLKHVIWLINIGVAFTPIGRIYGSTEAVNKN